MVTERIVGEYQGSVVSLRRGQVKRPVAPLVIFCFPHVYSAEDNHRDRRAMGDVAGGVQSPGYLYGVADSLVGDEPIRPRSG